MREIIHTVEVGASPAKVERALRRRRAWRDGGPPGFASTAT